LLILASSQSGRCADSLKVTAIAPGVSLKQFEYKDLYNSRQKFFVVDANLNLPGVRLHFPYLVDGKKATVQAFAEQTPRAVAAVNAQFFDAQGSIQFLKVGGAVINPTRSAGYTISRRLPSMNVAQ
jgi:hypothetical protein